MPNEASMLKDFIQLGATFLLAAGLLYYIIRRLDVMNDRLVRILTLLVVLTKTITNFNGIEHVLQGDSEKVVKTLPDNEIPTS